MNEKTIYNIGIFVLLLIMFSAGVLTGNFISGKHTTGTSGIAVRYNELKSGFAEQQELIGQQQAILERVRGEVDAANGIIDRAITTSGRAAERIQDIIEKMDTLIACIRNIDNAVTGRNSSNGGE